MTARDEADPVESLQLLEPEQEHELAEALRAAYAPEPLPAARHAELVALALEDPFAPASADELRESERLRQALESADERHPDVGLANALRAAARPTAAALPPPELHLPSPSRAKRPNVVFVTFGALALAAAAGMALWLTRPQVVPTSAVSTTARTLVPSRTTGELFSEPFAPGDATARMDRITQSRARDLRENRYRLWGVP